MVGGWEHECCGPPVERDQVVDLGCLRVAGPDGEASLVEARHDAEPELRVRGRVRHILVVRPGAPAEPVLRLPGGEALRGLDPADDGHLETPWTGERLPPGREFLVVVSTAGQATSPSGTG